MSDFNTFETFFPFTEEDDSTIPELAHVILIVVLIGVLGLHKNYSLCI